MWSKNYNVTSTKKWKEEQCSTNNRKACDGFWFFCNSYFSLYFVSLNKSQVFFFNTSTVLTLYCPWLHSRFFMIRPDLHFKSEFTSKGFKKFQQKKKLTPVGILPTTLTITASKVSYLSNCANQTCAAWGNLTEVCSMHFFTIWTSRFIRACLM